MSETTIGGSLIPTIMKGITRLLEQGRDPTTKDFVLDPELEELRIVEPTKGEVVATIPY